MNKLPHSIFLIAFAMVFLPIEAHSTSIPDRGPIPFSAYDKDGDGLINEKEFNDVRAERMSKRAADARPMRGAASAPSFSEFDADKNGTLTEDELVVGQKLQMDKRRSMKQGGGMAKGMRMGKNMPLFTDYDLDGDGQIVENEFNEARSKRISERAQQGYQMKNLVDAPSFGDIDVNGDGKISAEEFKGHQSQHRQKKQ